MTSIGVVEVIAVIAMAGGMFTILWTRRARGIGLRVIQFCAVVFAFPMILILDVHFISSLPVILRSACKAWVDRGPVQIVAAED